MTKTCTLASKGFCSGSDCVLHGVCPREANIIKQMEKEANDEVSESDLS